MPSCPVCRENMEGLPMFVSKKCKHGICGGCLRGLVEIENNRFRCPKCFEGGVIQAEEDYACIVSPLEGTDTQHPRDRAEAIIAYRRLERRLLELDPNWGDLLTALNQELDSLKAEYAEDLPVHDLPAIDASIHLTREQLESAISLVQSLEAKVQEYQARVQHERETLAQLHAEGDAQKQAIDALLPQEQEAFDESSKELDSIRDCRARAQSAHDVLRARLDKERAIEADMQRRHEARLELIKRMRKDMDARGVRTALTIFKFFRGSVWAFMAFIVAIVAIVQFKILYEHYLTVISL
ncbi:hypothetical protein EV121DRAFT_194609 [Schizophyllum commune]